MPLALLMLVAILGGCAYSPPRDPASPYYPPPRGTTLQLHTALTIPADKASVFLQGGRVTGYPGVDRYRPYCKLEMWSVTDQPRTLRPDTFEVTRVVRDYEYVRAPARLPRLAAGSAFRLVGADDYGGPMAAVMRTEMFLASERQPDIYRLSCEHWDEVAFSKHLSIEQIRDALDGVFTLELPAGG